MKIRITPNDKGNPPGKLADAELHFEAGEPCTGLKLIGFGVWERPGGNGRNVTFPARQYSINGERRSFALLRPIEDTCAQNGIREAIIAAYEAYEASTRPSNPEATPTDTQLEALRTEAGQAGDLAQVALCDRALDGDAAALAACARVITYAAAQE